MQKVLVIDEERGECWSQVHNLVPEETLLQRYSNWFHVVDELKEDTPDLILCNLDCESHRSSIFDELVSANEIDKQVPIIMLSSSHSVLVEGLSSIADQITRLEVCHFSNGMSYLKNRIHHYLLANLVHQNHRLALKEESGKYQLLLDYSSEGIIQYDDVGQVHYVNPKALQILEYQKNELINTNVINLLYQSTDNKNRAETHLTELTRQLLNPEAFSNNRVQLKTKSQKVIVTEMNCNCVMDDNGNTTSHIMLFQDVTARTQNEQRLIKLAKYDVLTGLSNRAKFHDFTEGKIAYCKHNNKKLALLFIDVDHFKNINESMGHDAGDDLLIDVAERLRSCSRESDLVSRIGGDEFAITLLEMGNPSQITRIVQNILDILSKPYFIQSKEISISASIGISLYPESGKDIKALTITADTAVHQAKADGRNTYRFFSEEIQNRVIEQHSLEAALKRALSNSEFFMHYQPLVDAVSGRIVGLEALIRWQHEDWPNIGPHRFIPIAEECGLLPLLGKWVLHEACRQSLQWLNDPEIEFNYPVSVNLSPKQLVHNDFVDLLVSTLNETGMPPENLVLELTETAVMQNPELAISTLNKINAAGVKLAVDDFGTGYSSLNYLKQLPINKLKIDRSFVNDIGVNANGEAIVKAILALAHSLNLEVVAEGVEEQSQVEFLRGHECEILQGYFFSKPKSVAEIRELLKQEKIKWGSAPAEVTKDAKVNSDLPLH